MKPILVSAWLLLMIGAANGQTGAAWREDFQTLENWSELNFQKIPKHSLYRTEMLDGQTVLRAESDNSASGLICRQSFNPFETPVLRWRWRVDNIFQKGDATCKDGDDYPLRVYVLFTYDPALASF
jgi:hypothetical protein